MSRAYDGEWLDLGLLVRLAGFSALWLGETWCCGSAIWIWGGGADTVPQSVAGARGKIRIGETKTGERRSVPIAASLLEPLAEQIHGRRRDEFVWPNRVDAAIEALQTLCLFSSALAPKRFRNG